MIEKTRKTNETNITIKLKTEDTDITGTKVEIGVAFFEHMLKALLFYANLEMELQCEGDLEIDEHHSLEDIGILMGETLLTYYREIGKFQRFSSDYMPMDEALVRTVVDISGRSYFQIDGLEIMALSSLEQSIIEFLRSFSINAKLTVHIDVLKGINRHHIFEAIFKSFGRCLKESLTLSTVIMTTKGSIL